MVYILLAETPHDRNPKDGVRSNSSYFGNITISEAIAVIGEGTNAGKLIEHNTTDKCHCAQYIYHKVMSGRAQYCA